MPDAKVVIVARRCPCCDRTELVVQVRGGEHDGREVGSCLPAECLVELTTQLLLEARRREVMQQLRQRLAEVGAL